MRGSGFYLLYHSKQTEEKLVAMLDQAHKPSSCDFQPDLGFTESELWASTGYRVRLNLKKKKK